VPSGHPSVNREEMQSVKEKKRKEKKRKEKRRKEIRIHTAGYMK
jgi:hypothetical protein